MEQAVANVLKRFLTQEFWLLERQVARGDGTYRFVLDGSLWDVTEEEAKALERFAASE